MFSSISYLNYSIKIIRTTTKLTRDMALTVIFHQYNIPAILTRTEVITRMMINDEMMFMPVRKKDTRKTAKSDRPRERNASCSMTRYCS